LKAALSIAGPLVVPIGAALPYVKEIIPILQTLVDIYNAKHELDEEYAALKSYLDKIQVHRVTIIESFFDLFKFHIRGAWCSVYTSQTASSLSCNNRVCWSF
jgi:hypothetical protein